MSSAAEGLVREIDEDLRRAGSAERAEGQKAYLKSPLEHYGASVPAIRAAVGRTLETHGVPTRRTLLAMVELLWSGAVHEQRMAAVLLLEAGKETLQSEDLGLIEDMIRGSFTWAYVDNLSATVAGSLVDRYPHLAEELDRWATDESFWVRRGAMLALLGPLRAGAGDWRRFKRYADSMLEEKEFFIRKAIGWVLRETSKRRPDLVRRYVEARLDRLSGVTFREAVKRLPEADRDRLGTERKRVPGSR